MIAFEYKDRRREGDTTLRQCQLAQLYILHAIDAVCKAHDLIYLLEGGTLLGAMRHNGFIPWDDDLDIGMPRRDYEKFLKIAPKELPEGLSLHTPSATPCVAIPFAKIRDRQSFYCECRVDTRTSDPSGIYVDIFPYDDVPAVGRFCQDLLVGICASSWMRVRYFYNVGGCNFFAVVGCAVLAVGCQVAHALSCRLIGLLNGLFGSKQVIACLEVGYPFRYEKDKMFPPSVHVFEDGEFPIPRDADGILTSQYGDWRQVPPPEKRPRHARIIDPFHAATAD